MINVIVVGAGLAGLSLSLGLARLDCIHHVDLVEQRENFASSGSTFGLAPNGMKALEELCPGITQPLEKQGTELPGDAGYLLGWWMVRDELLSQVQKHSDKITIRNGWSIDYIEDNKQEEAVKAGFIRSDAIDESGPPIFCRDENMMLSGNLLVGADGIRSSVRELLNLPKATNSSAMVWRGRIDATQHPILAPLLDQGVSPVLIRSGHCVFKMFNFQKISHGTMSWSASSTHPDIRPDIDCHPWTVFEKELKSDKDKRLVKAVFDVASERDLKVPVCNRVIPLPNDLDCGWGGKGRVTLLGDAAHAMRAINALGGAMAFEDSAILCRLLRNQQVHLSDWEYTNRAVHEFENTRLPRVKKIWENQWERAERVYLGEKYQQWSPDFKRWVYSGV